MIRVDRLGVPCTRQPQGTKAKHHLVEMFRKPDGQGMFGVTHAYVQTSIDSLDNWTVQSKICEVRSDTIG